MYTNANSIVGKMDELRQKVSNHRYDVIAITESWASADISDAELKIDGYLMYRKDKADDSRTKGGGVLLYVTEELRSHPLPNISSAEFQDTAWCKIEAGTCAVIVGVCYRSTSSSKQNNDNLLHLLEKVTCLGSQSRLLIFGDFNYPGIDYVNYKAEGGPNTDAYRFFNKTNDLYLHQHVENWTRFCDGQCSSTLNYVFTDEENVVNGISYSAPLGKSDHVCISMKYIIEQLESQTYQTVYDYWRGDYKAINEELRKLDWDELLSNKRVDEAWMLFQSRITSLTEQYVPLKRGAG